MEQERFDQLADRFEEARDSNGDPLRMHALLVGQGERQFVHRFGGRTGPSDIRSLSKTVLTLIAGTLAARDPSFGLETAVWELLEPAVERSWVAGATRAYSGVFPGGAFSNAAPPSGSTLSDGALTAQREPAWRDPKNQERWKQVRVKHLISHTTGFDQVLMMRGDIKDLDPASLLSYVAGSPLKHEPGQHYLYSNAGFYLLSAFLELYLSSHGQGSLEDFAREAFFEPLGIDDWSWEKYGDYLAGATRLWLNPEDVGKIGHLLLAEGRIGGDTGRQLVPREWVQYMRTPTALTPGVETMKNDRFRRHAYGSGLWVGAKEGIFFGHGTGGQTLLVLPQCNAVVVTLADQGDVKSLEEVVEQVAQAL